jgi:CBS domain containing-hemolysin-like protein
MLITALTILAIVALMIFFNALYVAGEFASVSARKTRIMQLAEGGNRLAKMILPVLQDRHKLDNYIAASQVGITLSSIVLGIYGEQQIAPRIAPWIARLPLIGEPSATGPLVTTAAAAGIASTLVLLFLTTLQVVLGELVPKSVALQYPERVALLTALPMKWSADYLLKPLIALLNGSGALLLRLLGATSGQEHTHVHSPEEIVILVKESFRGGLIDADERQFLQNVFRSSQIHAGEIAIPRTRMVAAAIDESVEHVLRLAAESAFTRIPIYEEDTDHIVGFVHLRDLFALYRTDPGASLRRILRPVPFVPESLPVAAVWEQLNEAQSYLAIVFDEYGGTSGLVTREDLVEELFGELQDEFDEERDLIAPAGEGRIVVRGDVLVANLNDLLEIDLPHQAAHTIGGLVMDALGRLPRVGDAVEFEDVRIRVEAVSHRSVTAVCVSLPSTVSDQLPEGVD